MTDTVAATDSFPETKQRIVREQRNRAAVRAWLYLVCLLVLAMVMVGGATRLTDSGLSITEWKPVHGIFPPLGARDWQAEFDKYRQIPEYTRINRGMTLAEFKVIYWWEWSHRQLGRLIGLVFALPLTAFWLSGRLEERLKPRLLGLLALGGLQGIVGWWMVTSGLVERTDVSQYRLAVHLILACAIFAYAMWIARGLAPHSAEPAEPALGQLAMIVTLLILFQIFLGGLVAGLDAGLTFNDWPTMDGEWIPGGLLLLEPAWRNFFENPKAVQFVHRAGAYLLLGLMVLQCLATRSKPLASQHRRRALLLLLATAVQAVLGVATLRLQVPVSLALAHQALAVILLGFAVAHWRALCGPYPPVTAIELRH